MHIHILGICGTFMAGVALLARAAGHRVSGSDAGAYPPMSTQLEAHGIEVLAGYRPEHLQPAPDMVVIGNVVSRGNAAVEYVLDRGLAYTSGPQWLAEHVLRDRWVLAVAGTHGKTTTASLLAWLLTHAGLEPGFLIGGVPGNFGASARLGDSPFFVVEADEYDTAFFDKRSKFVHYRPRTLVLNNLEYDHADIFPDLAAIERQFHYLIRTVPASGLIVCNGADPNLDRVLSRGCWSELAYFDRVGGWEALAAGADGRRFQVRLDAAPMGTATWPMLGRHNISNALAALAAARHVGVPPALGIQGLAGFKGVKRRLELRGRVRGVEVLDDFAHHPTAIAATLAAVRATIGEGRLIAVLEPRSNTMRMGVHRATLAESLRDADMAFVYARDDLDWNAAALGTRAQVHRNLDELVAAVAGASRHGDCIVVMSNGDFGGIHDKLLAALAVTSGRTGGSS